MNIPESSYQLWKPARFGERLIVPGGFWEGPPKTGANSSRQEAAPKGREQPSRESSPIKGSVAKWEESMKNITRATNLIL